MSGQAIAADRNVWCARCDMRNPAGSLYCVGCGVSLCDDASASTAPRRQRCGACGIANPAGALYCVSCGLSLADPVAPRRPIQYAPAALATAAGDAPGGTIVRHIYIAAPAQAELPLLARALWFVFVGVWVGQVWLIMAWLLNLTLVGLPLGVWMLNRMPQIMTLRSGPQRAPIAPAASGAGFVVRAVYFVLIGWWVSLLWMELAWLAALSAIGLPLSFLMFERVGTVTTLAEA
jgi:uncharacterized membrane protein YccF (DUF307 family)